MSRNLDSTEQPPDQQRWQLTWAHILVPTKVAAGLGLQHSFSQAPASPAQAATSCRSLCGSYQEEALSPAQTEAGIDLPGTLPKGPRNITNHSRLQTTAEHHPPAPQMTPPQCKLSWQENTANATPTLWDWQSRATLTAGQPRVTPNTGTPTAPGAQLQQEDTYSPQRGNSRNTTG